MTRPPTGSKTLGAYLRRARESAGLSQREVARVVGASQPSVAHVEAGTRPLPRAWIPALSAILHIEAYALDVLSGRIPTDAMPGVEADPEGTGSTIVTLRVRGDV